MKRKALGKGLSSLIPQAPAARAAKASRAAAPVPVSEVDGRAVEIDIDRIRPNPRQPRRAFEAEALADLAQSISSNGVIQPVVVRRSGERDGFELIAGERRWRAAQQAGLLRLPAVVRDVPDERLLEVALIENIQREDLNPIEEAEAYRALIDRAGLTQDELGDRVGKNRATIANTLRLLGLAGSVQELVRDRKISMGHARAITALENPSHQIAAAKAVVADGLSVRATEQLVARLASSRDPRRRASAKRDPNVVAAEESLQADLGTRVRIFQNAKGAGRLELHFHDADELDRLYELVRRAARKANKTKS